MVRIAAAADDSFAAILARHRLGIAIAAIKSMIATTIISSISENPRALSPLCAKFSSNPTTSYAMHARYRFSSALAHVRWTVIY